MSDILHDFGKAAKAYNADSPQADAGSKPTTVPLVPRITDVPEDSEAHVAAKALVVCGADPVENNVYVNGLTMASGQPM